MVPELPDAALAALASPSGAGAARLTCGTPPLASAALLHEYLLTLPRAEDGGEPRGADCWPVGVVVVDVDGAVVPAPAPGVAPVVATAADSASTLRSVLILDGCWVAFGFFGALL